MGVFKKGKSWWIDFYHQGKRIRRKVGPSKRVAEMALADIQVKKAKKEFLGVCEPKRILFKDFAAEYLEYSTANKAKSSHLREENLLSKHVIPRWGGEYLSAITPRMIEQYKQDRIRSKKCKAGTLNREVQTVRSMFRKALEWGYLGENPAQTVKLLRVPKGSFRFLSREEADKLLDACRESMCRQLFPCVAVALHTGMRLGEIFHLRWSDVGLKEKRIQVVSREGAHTKNYDSRTIPISEFLLDVLNAHPRRLDTPYVFFQQNGSPLTNIRPQFEIAIRRAEIEHVRFHDLRHTFASWLVMGGVDIRTVQELLGHKKIDMTMRYAHLAPDHMRNAIRVLDGHPMDTESNFSVDEAESECNKVG